jgi:nitrite reductase/ring-hydroxylating ferredoxin subunit
MTWRLVASAADAERAHPWLAVDVEGLPLALAMVGGAWHAVEDRCTHAGCPFSSEATIEGGTIVCNCHGSEFDLATGDVLRGPADYPVRSIPARLRGDGIEVDL